MNKTSADKCIQNHFILTSKIPRPTRLGFHENEKAKKKTNKQTKNKTKYNKTTQNKTKKKHINNPPGDL